MKDRQRLVSSGGALAVDTGQGHVALLQGFSIDHFGYNQNVQDVHGLGDAFTKRVVTSCYAEFHVTSRGQLRFLPAEEADHLFFDPATASVDELLRLAYAKLDERSQHEAQQTLRLNLK